MTNLRKHDLRNHEFRKLRNMYDQRKRELFWMVPAAILGITLFVFIGGEIVMRLWNWLLPTLFGWRQITFWQAVGILALCRILFGGHGLPRFRSFQYAAAAYKSVWLNVGKA